MSQTTAVLSRRGELLAVPSGLRVQIDPLLRSAEGIVLAPTFVAVGQGFLVASIQDTPAPDFGTFDAQNITTLPQDLQWYAEWTHTIQKSNLQPDASTLGPNGLQPSPRAPLVIASGGGVGNVEFFTAPVSFATPGVIPLTALNPGDVIASSEIHLTTSFDDPLASLAIGDGVTAARFLSIPAPNAAFVGIWQAGNTDAITVPATLTLTQVSAGTQGAGLLLVRIKRA